MAEEKRLASDDVVRCMDWKGMVDHSVALLGQKLRKGMGGLGTGEGDVRKIVAHIGKSSESSFHGICCAINRVSYNQPRLFLDGMEMILRSSVFFR